jgi:hypothetical protein
MGETDTTEQTGILSKNHTMRNNMCSQCRGHQHGESRRAIEPCRCDVIKGAFCVCNGAILQRYFHHRLTEDTASARSLVRTGEETFAVPERS